MGYQQTLFLIKSAKLLRMLGNGIIIIIFIKNLYQKEIPEQSMFLIQAALYFGTMATSYLIKSNQRRIGTKNALLLGTLLTLITSIVFAQQRNLNYLFGMAFVGMMPVLGEDLEIFTSIQKSILTRLLASESKSKSELVQNKKKQLHRYEILGHISQIIGCIIVYYGISFTMSSVQTSDTIYLYMLRFYTLLASLQFIAYLLTDRGHIQYSFESNDKTKLRNQIVECVRPGTFMFLTFLVFFSTSILNMTDFIYFLHQKYLMQMFDVVPIIISLILISKLASYLTKKIFQKGFGKIFLIIGIPFNLMFIHVALTQKLGKLQFIAIFTNLITNAFIINIWYDLKLRLNTQQQLQTYKSYFSFFKHIGTVISIVIYAIFSIFEGTTIPYSVTIIICGGIKSIASIFLISCLSCLGNYSFNSKQNQDIELQNNHFQQIKGHGEENQTFHLPNTH